MAIAAVLVAVVAVVLVAMVVVVALSPAVCSRAKFKGVVGVEAKTRSGPGRDW